VFLSRDDCRGGGCGDNGVGCGGNFGCWSGLSQTANGGADGGAGLIFCDGLGENQFGSEAEGGRQAGAAVDNRDRHGIIAVLSAAANIEDELSGGEILTIDEYEVESLRSQFLGGGDAVERAFAGD
jgi:hypothetical protein